MSSSPFCTFMVKMRKLAACGEHWETLCVCVYVYVCLQFAAPQLTPAVKNAKNSDQGEGWSIKSIKETEGGRGNRWHDGCMSSGQRTLKGKWAVVLECWFFLPAFQQPGIIKQVAHGERNFSIRGSCNLKRKINYPEIQTVECLIFPKATLFFSETARGAVRNYCMK